VQRISLRVMLFLLIAAAIPLVTLFFTGLNEMRDTLAQAIENELQDRSRLLAGRISNSIVSAYNSIQIMVENSIITHFDRYPAKEVEAELRRIQQYTTIFDDLTLIDAKGIVRASTTYSYEGEWAAKTWFKQAQEGNPILSRAHLISNPRRSVSVMCLPLGENDTIPGILCGRIPLQTEEKSERKAIFAISDILLNSQLGEATHAFLVNEDAKLLMYGDTGRIFETLPADDPIRVMLAAKESSLWLKKQAEFASVAMVLDPFQIMSEHWSVVVTRDEDDAMAPLLGLMRGMVYSMLTALMIALLLSIFLSRRITIPIHKLAAATDRVAAGDLITRVSLKGKDELAQLARHFNEMADDLAMAMNRIRESEQRYRALVETAGEGIWALDQDGYILHANPALETILGNKNLVGHQVNELFTVIDPDQAGTRALIHPPTLVQEMMWRTKSGMEIWVLYAARRLEQIGQPDAKTFAVITDITERKNMERQLAVYSQNLERMVDERTRQLTDQSRRLADALAMAEKTDKSKGEFISRLSHEMRTPLNSVIGFAKIIQKEKVKYNLPNQVTGDIRIIQENGEHLLRLINDVLDVSKIQAGMLDLEIEELDACAIAGLVIDQAQGLLAENENIKVFNHLPPKGVWVRADEMRLQQIMSNLLSNAIKYTDQGEVHLNAQLKSGFWHFTVSDTGIGISHDDLPYIFEEFRQVRASHKQGSGLGLALVRLLVNKMGGQVWAESEIGVGSKFTFTIPAGLGPMLFTTPMPLTTEEAPMQRVLVINPDHTAGNYLADLLRAEGVAEVHVIEPDEAVKAASTLNPDALFINLFTTQTDMFNVLRDLQTAPAMAHMRLVIASVNPQDGNGYAIEAVSAFTPEIGRECLLSTAARIGKPVKRLLLYSDSIEEALRIGSFLQEEHVEVIKAFTSSDALELLDNVMFDSAMIDILNENGDGIWLLYEMRRRNLAVPCTILIPEKADFEIRDELAGNAKSLLGQRALTSEVIRRVITPEPPKGAH